MRLVHLRVGRRGGWGVLLLVAAALAVSWASADERKREARLSGAAQEEKPQEAQTKEASAEPGFTWRRDRPFGEIGFPSDDFGPHWEFLRLATLSAVQEELDLSPEQIARLQPVYQGLMAAQRDWTKGRDNADILKEEYEQARRVLTEEQALRIQQIKLQRRGVQAFLHADLQETLGLRPEQIQVIRQAWDEHVEKAKRGWLGDEGRQSYHQVWRRALETLTEAQRRQFYQFTGPVVLRKQAAPPLMKTGAASAAPTKGRLPTYLEQVESWLPLDIETLFAAEDFEPKHPQAVGTPEMPVLSLRDAARHVALGPLWELEDLLSAGSHQSPGADQPAGDERSCLEELAERRIAWVVFAGRNFLAPSGQDEVVEGRYLYEGCSLVQFAEPLGPAGEAMMKRLRSQASETWQVADQEILVFSSGSEGSPAVPSAKPGQGIYFVQLAPNLLLIANHDVFLWQVLRSRQASQRILKLRESPPLLQVVRAQVARDAAAWGVRVVPEKRHEQTDVRSVVWTCSSQKPEVFQVALTAASLAGGEESERSLRRYLGPLLRGAPSFVQTTTMVDKGAAVVIAQVPLDQADSKDLRWIATLSHLRGVQ